MTHFAELDPNNIVTRVIVAEPEFVATLPGRWVQTSYNHRTRKQFAGVGYRYDEHADVFVAPQPHPSWVLDANHDWQPPVARPDGAWRWDEPTFSWVEREE
jgi:hypothetical protein